jgi:hypothetical protein
MTERRDPAPVNVLIRFWCDEYERHAGAKYPFAGGKDGKTIKDLRAIYSDDDLRTFIAAFFEIDDDFIQNSGYSLGVFRGCLPKVIRFVNGKRPKGDMYGHVPPCKTITDCIAKVLADGKQQRTQAS